MNELQPIFDKPELPVEWNYQKSVEKVKAINYHWRTLTEEVFIELSIARGMLAIRTGRPKVETNVPTYSWDGYCDDIGVEKRTVNRWLKAHEEGRKQVTEKQKRITEEGEASKRRKKKNEIVSPAFKLAWEGLKAEIYNAKTLNWKITSKEEALRLCQILIDMIEI